LTKEEAKQLAEGYVELNKAWSEATDFVTAPDRQMDADAQDRYISAKVLPMLPKRRKELVPVAELRATTTVQKLLEDDDWTDSFRVHLEKAMEAVETGWDMRYPATQKLCRQLRQHITSGNPPTEEDAAMLRVAIAIHGSFPENLAIALNGAYLENLEQYMEETSCDLHEHIVAAWMEKSHPDQCSQPWQRHMKTRKTREVSKHHHKTEVRATSAMPRSDAFKSPEAPICRRFEDHSWLTVGYSRRAENPTAAGVVAFRVNRQGKAIFISLASTLSGDCTVELVRETLNAEDVIPLANWWGSTVKRLRFVYLAVMDQDIDDLTMEEAQRRVSLEVPEWCYTQFFFRPDNKLRGGYQADARIFIHDHEVNSELCFLYMPHGRGLSTDLVEDDNSTVDSSDNDRRLSEVDARPRKRTKRSHQEGDGSKPECRDWVKTRLIFGKFVLVGAQKGDWVGIALVAWSEDTEFTTCPLLGSGQCLPETEFKPKPVSLTDIQFLDDFVGLGKEGFKILAKAILENPGSLITAARKKIDISLTAPGLAERPGLDGLHKPACTSTQRQVGLTRLDER
jgi:hypothetical protein